MQLKLRLGLVFLILGWDQAGAQGIQPYLQSPTDTSVWITWKTSSGNGSKVLFGEDPGDLSDQVTGQCEILQDTDYDGTYFYHAVRLTGLQPNHAYYYQAVTDSQISSVYRFRTQPNIAQPGGIYRFLVFGDHQVRADDRYELLLKAARNKVLEKFGGNIEDHINLVLNDGDQVDAGTLDQYENVHFKPSAILSGNIPFMTTVGNHETYGSIGLPLYYAHYFYDDLNYKGIVNPGGENYYAYRQKNILFIHLSSEHPGDDQTGWVQELIDSVRADPTVDWVISIAHRPIQAEQYVGDISLYIRDQVIPILSRTEKSVLLITGHHHLYARGQLRDHPIYHIISGGGSWDQYWGQSTESDFDDVQKTIDYWTYQIVTLDADKDMMRVESYAIGSPKLGMTLNNELIDTFYRKLPGVPPSKPSILTVPDDTITLPCTFVSSPYSTGSGEPYNSVRYQVSTDSNFSISLVDRIRDFENLYGTTGYPDYRPVNIHEGLDIFQFRIAEQELPNGTYFIRVRHRDRNIEWSAWSDPVRFTVKGSIAGFTAISAASDLYKPGENIDITYQFGPGNEKDWIGIYRDGDIPGYVSSVEWGYVSGQSGTLTLHVSQPGKYFIGFFKNDGYTELAKRLSVYISATPLLELEKSGYDPDEVIRVKYSDAPGITNDWIGIYKLGDIPGIVGSTLWQYTTGSEGNLEFEGLTAGYYFVSYFLDDGYLEAGQRTIFAVGNELARVMTGKSSYHSGEVVMVNFENGPGTGADWIGIFRQDASPGTAPLVDREQVGSRTAGSINFSANLDPGDYYAALFINNTSARISGKALFSVTEEISSVPGQTMEVDFMIYPSPTSGRFRIRYPENMTGDPEIRIISSTGQPVPFNQPGRKLSAGSVEIDLSGLHGGLYTIVFRYADNSYTRKIVKIK